MKIMEVLIVMTIIGIISVIAIPNCLLFKCRGYARSLGVPHGDIKILCDEYASSGNMKEVVSKVAHGRLSVEDALLMSDDNYTPQDILTQEPENNDSKDDTQIQTLNSKIELLESQLYECMNSNIQTNEDNRTWKD
jgi:hypothetical protein